LAGVVADEMKKSANAETVRRNEMAKMAAM